VHAEAQLSLNGVQLGHHALLRRFPPDGERSIAPALPAKVREAQKRKGLRLPFSTPLSILCGEPPKLDQSCFLWMQFQPEFRQAFPKSLQELLGFHSVFEAYNQIIGIADDDYVPRSHFLAPSLDPQIESVVQVHVGEQW